eukprot:1799810-Pleurochrysis_carterae.AAC.6
MALCLEKLLNPSWPSLMRDEGLREALEVFELRIRKVMYVRIRDRRCVPAEQARAGFCCAASPRGRSELALLGTPILGFVVQHVLISCAGRTVLMLSQLIQTDERQINSFMLAVHRWAPDAKTTKLPRSLAERAEWMCLCLLRDRDVMSSCLPPSGPASGGADARS